MDLVWGGDSGDSWAVRGPGHGFFRGHRTRGNGVWIFGRTSAGRIAWSGGFSPDSGDHGRIRPSEEWVRRVRRAGGYPKGSWDAGKQAPVPFSGATG